MDFKITNYRTVGLEVKAPGSEFEVVPPNAVVLKVTVFDASGTGDAETGGIGWGCMCSVVLHC